MAKTNRASGWKKAKITGHLNEHLAKKRLDEDAIYRNDFMKCIGYNSETIKNITVGGLHEKEVPSVLGKKTKSKTDMKVFCNSGKIITFSIKKSLKGQVYLVSAKNFIDAYEKQFKEKIPAEVTRAIKLFWSDDDGTKKIIEKYGDKSNDNSYNLQIKHKSLNATTLKKYNKELHSALLNWFINHAYNITKFVFTMGAAENSSEWSDFIWYINALGENGTDEIFKIEDICSSVKRVAVKETYYGTKNGGTTIQLPFGFVQWHQNRMQFHHCYEKISNLLKASKG